MHNGKYAANKHFVIKDDQMITVTENTMQNKPNSLRSAHRRARQARFLDRFSILFSVSRTAIAAGIGRRTVYDWLHSDAAFKKKYEMIILMGCDALEDEAIRRTLVGTVKPVMYKGKKVGEKRRFSNGLLALLVEVRLAKKHKAMAARSVYTEKSRPVNTPGETDLIQNAPVATQDCKTTGMAFLTMHRKLAA